MYGETPLGTAFKSGKRRLVDLLDKDRLLPRDDDNESKLETTIVKVLKASTHILYRASIVYDH